MAAPAPAPAPTFVSHPSAHEMVEMLRVWNQERQLPAWVNRFNPYVSHPDALTAGDDCIKATASDGSESWYFMYTLQPLSSSSKKNARACGGGTWLGERARPVLMITQGNQRQLVAWKNALSHGTKEGKGKDRRFVRDGWLMLEVYLTDDKRKVISRVYRTPRQHPDLAAAAAPLGTHPAAPDHPADPDLAAAAAPLGTHPAAPDHPADPDQAAAAAPLGTHPAAPDHPADPDLAAAAAPLGTHPADPLPALLPQEESTAMPQGTPTAPASPPKAAAPDVPTPLLPAKRKACSLAAESNGSAPVPAVTATKWVWVEISASPTKTGCNDIMKKVFRVVFPDNDEAVPEPPPAKKRLMEYKGFLAVSPVN